MFAMAEIAEGFKVSPGFTRSVCVTEGAGGLTVWILSWGCFTREDLQLFCRRGCVISEQRDLLWQCHFNNWAATARQLIHIQDGHTRTHIHTPSQCVNLSALSSDCTHPQCHTQSPKCRWRSVGRQKSRGQQVLLGCCLVLPARLCEIAVCVFAGCVCVFLHYIYSNTYIQYVLQIPVHTLRKTFPLPKKRICCCL